MDILGGNFFVTPAIIIDLRLGGTLKATAMGVNVARTLKPFSSLPNRQPGNITMDSGQQSRLQSRPSKPPGRATQNILLFVGRANPPAYLNQLRI